MPVKVTATGPLFTPGAVGKVLDEIRDDIAGRIGAEGKRRVIAVLDGSLRRPTGAYRSRVTLYGPVAGQARVHDDRGIYGPWLNGTGSRNYPATRFRGYGHFTKTQQVLERAARPLAQQVVSEHLGKLGG